MHQSGLGESIIIRQIQLYGLKHPFTVDDLIDLRNQGLPDRVIEACQMASAAGGGNRPLVRSPQFLDGHWVAPAPLIAVPYEVVPAPRCYDSGGWGLHLDW